MREGSPLGFGALGVLSRKVFEIGVLTHFRRKAPVLEVDRPPEIFLVDMSTVYVLAMNFIAIYKLSIAFSVTEL